eukprot:scaffold270828_cov32-Tisochrysis_lutea.AAC.1
MCIVGLAHSSHLAKGASVLDGIVESNSLKTFPGRDKRLVRRQDAVASPRDLAGGCDHLLDIRVLFLKQRGHSSGRSRRPARRTAAPRARRCKTHQQHHPPGESAEGGREGEREEEERVTKGREGRQPMGRDRPSTASLFTDAGAAWRASLCATPPTQTAGSPGFLCVYKDCEEAWLRGKEGERRRFCASAAERWREVRRVSTDPFRLLISTP